MASTFSIPLITLPVGSRDFGPVSVPDADSRILITIDRTVTGGLNSQPGTTTLNLAFSESNDGGATWQPLASAGAAGGLIFNRHTGANETALGVSVSLMSAASRQLRATVTVTGTPVAVQGTITTQ